MLGRNVCSIAPNAKKGGCCGGGPRAPVINGFYTVNLRSNGASVYELLIPGDRLPSAWSGGRITHDNRLFTNCRLYEDGEELKVLCVVISPFRDEIVVFTPRGQRASRFKEIDAARQLNIFVRGAILISRRAGVVDMGTALTFNGVGNPDPRACGVDPRERNRSLKDLENEFWAGILILEALLYSSESFEISAGGVCALRTVFDAVSRQEKIDAIANWAASLGDRTLNQQNEAEANMRAQVQMETQKLEVEIQRERLRVEAEQIELAKKQQVLAAQRAALQATTSPLISPTTYEQPRQTQQPTYQPLYQQQPYYGYQPQSPPPPPPPYYGQPPPPYGGPPPPPPYGGGPPPPHGGGYGPCGGHHGPERRGHSTGKAVAMGLGAGVLGALVTDMIIN